MAQPITDYAAFFADAKRAVEELEQLKQKEADLGDREKQIENALRAKQRTAADEISQTVKKRTDEITQSYDAEIKKIQERLKKARGSREKAKNQGIKERIAEETQGTADEISDLKARMKTLFRANHVPGFCRSRYYYALYFTKGIKEAGMFFLTLLICFLGIPCGIYFLIPERKTWYLVAIYVAVILVFGGIYVIVGNMTKMRYMDVLKEGRQILNQIRASRKQMKAIARLIRKDKNEAAYNLEKFDDEIAQFDQDLLQVTKKKKDALNTFNSVTKTIISDEIMGNYKADLEQAETELAETTAELKDTQNAMKEKALFITDHYAIYVGKEFVTTERLTALEEIIKSGAASNISEAITVYKSKNYQGGTEAQ